MRIPDNQQLGHTWLIFIPYAHHDNWSVLGQQWLSIPGLECSGRTKKTMEWCVLPATEILMIINQGVLANLGYCGCGTETRQLRQLFHAEGILPKIFLLY